MEKPNHKTTKKKHGDGKKPTHKLHNKEKNTVSTPPAPHHGLCLGPNWGQPPHLPPVPNPDLWVPTGVFSNHITPHPLGGGDPLTPPPPCSAPHLSLVWGGFPPNTRPNSHFLAARLPAQDFRR